MTNEPTEKDDGENEEIIKLLKDRLKIGFDRYGHGVRPMDDTTTWGTERDSWIEMGLEEALDLSIYLGAAILRIRHLEDSAIERHKELNTLMSKLKKAEMDFESKVRSHKGGARWWKRWNPRRS